MNKLFLSAAALTLCASAALADQTVRIERDGVLYDCEEQIVTKDGVQHRRCVVADVGGSSAGLFEGGIGGGVGAAVLVAVAVAALASGGGDNATTGTPD